MNEVVLKDDIKIENMIYEVRGKQVMLASDIAKLYQVETKRINEVVKRNTQRFPSNFCFQLTEGEFENLRSQIATSSEKNGKLHGGVRYLPFVFTEHGIMMLSGLLKSDIAAKVNVVIINAFVAMRKYISSNLLEQKYINNMVLEHDSEIKLLQESFSRFEEKKIINEIYFDGQIYDAYSKIKDIISSAKQEVIIIDAYADKTVLDLVKELKVNVILIVKRKTLLTILDIDRYNSQYHNLKIIYNDTFHDRYFILDKKVVYHCGSSINHAGSKTFSINLLEDTLIIDSLIDKITTLT